MVEIRVRGRDGADHQIEAEPGRSLMEILRAADFGVAGTCGGMCSCGSCHVYVAAVSQASLTPPTEEEADMLDALSDVVEVRETSRLSCQIVVQEPIGIEIAPQL